MPKDLPKLAGLYSKDVLGDFLKEYSAKYEMMEKAEQKSFNKLVGNRSKDFTAVAYCHLK